MVSGRATTTSDLLAPRPRSVLGPLPQNADLVASSLPRLPASIPRTARTAPNSSVVTHTRGSSSSSISSVTLSSTFLSSTPSLRRNESDRSSSQDVVSTERTGSRNHDVHTHHQIALSTLDACIKGYVDVPVSPAHAHSRPTSIRHQLTQYFNTTKESTSLYGEEDQVLVGWQNTLRVNRSAVGTNLGGVKVKILKMTTLQGARYLADKMAPPLINVRSPSALPIKPSRKIGILNFASPTTPGGGFLDGALSQESSILRASSLYLSLNTPQSQWFYYYNQQSEKDAGRMSMSNEPILNGMLNGMYTHSMIYSPSVVLFKNDGGEWVKPLAVDVISSAAVDAGEVRSVFVARSLVSPTANAPSPTEIEAIIDSVMYERIARILALFEAKMIRLVVLGGFGTGGCKNDTKKIATIWKELLVGPHARFKDSFDCVLFAVTEVEKALRFAKTFGLTAV